MAAGTQPTQPTGGMTVSPWLDKKQFEREQARKDREQRMKEVAGVADIRRKDIESGTKRQSGALISADTSLKAQLERRISVGQATAKTQADTQDTQFGHNLKLQESFAKMRNDEAKVRSEMQTLAQQQPATVDIAALLAEHPNVTGQDMIKERYQKGGWAQWFFDWFSEANNRSTARRQGQPYQNNLMEQLQAQAKQRNQRAMAMIQLQAQTQQKQLSDTYNRQAQALQMRQSSLAGERDDIASLIRQQQPSTQLKQMVVRDKDGSLKPAVGHYDSKTRQILDENGNPIPQDTIVSTSPLPMQTYLGPGNMRMAASRDPTGQIVGQGIAQPTIQNKVISTIDPYTGLRVDKEIAVNYGAATAYQSKTLTAPIAQPTKVFAGRPHYTAAQQDAIDKNFGSVATYRLKITDVSAGPLRNAVLDKLIEEGIITFTDAGDKALWDGGKMIGGSASQIGVLGQMEKLLEEMQQIPRASVEYAIAMKKMNDFAEAVASVFARQVWQEKGNLAVEDVRRAINLLPTGWIKLFTDRGHQLALDELLIVRGFVADTMQATVDKYSKPLTTGGAQSTIGIVRKGGGGKGEAISAEDLNEAIKGLAQDLLGGNQ